MVHDSHSKHVTPLPYKIVIVLCLINVNESFVINMMWPMLPFFVDETIANNETETGFYVGILASSFFVTQFLSSFIWGTKTDTIGRKPVLLIGLAGSIVCVLLFGFATSYWMGVVARTLAGALNGNIATTKTALGDITDSSNQAKGFSVLAFTWGAGAIIAPLIGGFLQMPADKYSTFDNSFWRKFPFLLPSLMSAAVALIGLISGLLFLPETKELKQSKPIPLVNVNEIEDETSSDSIELLPVEKQQLDSCEVEVIEVNLNDEEESHFINAHNKSGYDRINTNDDFQIDKTHNDDSDDNNIDEYDNDNKSKKTIMKSDYMKVNSSIKVNEPTKKLTAKEVMKSSYIQVPCVVYGLTALSYVLFDELIPVYSKTSVKRGGLDFSSNQIGLMLMIQGLFLIIFQMIIFPKLSGAFALTSMIRIATWLLLPLSMIVPSLTYLSDMKGLLWLCIAITLGLKAGVAATAFTCAILLVNNSCENNSLGLVNGISQSYSSLARAIGPFVIGWSWSFSTTLSFTAHQYLAFTLVGVFIFATVILNRYLKMSHNRPLSEQ